MLVLSRKVGERIVVGSDIVVTVTQVNGNRVRLGFEVPESVSVNREEIFRRIAQEQGLCPVSSAESR